VNLIILSSEICARVAPTAQRIMQDNAIEYGRTDSGHTSELVLAEFTEEFSLATFASPLAEQLLAADADARQFAADWSGRS
jgi:hypothetical protein